MNDMASMWYKQHYQQKISPHLTVAQRQDVANRISQLTLQAPIWTDPDTNHVEAFPELAPYVNATLSGLYLCAILESIVKELGVIPDMGKYENG